MGSLPSVPGCEVAYGKAAKMAIKTLLWKAEFEQAWCRGKIVFDVVGSWLKLAHAGIVHGIEARDGCFSSKMMKRRSSSDCKAGDSSSEEFRGKDGDEGAEENASQR